MYRRVNCKRIFLIKKIMDRRVNCIDHLQSRSGCEISQNVNDVRMDVHKFEQNIKFVHKVVAELGCVDLLQVQNHFQSKLHCCLNAQRYFNKKYNAIASLSKDVHNFYFFECNESQLSGEEECSFDFF